MRKKNGATQHNRCAYNHCLSARTVGQTKGQQLLMAPAAGDLEERGAVVEVRVGGCPELRLEYVSLFKTRAKIPRARGQHQPPTASVAEGRRANDDLRAEARSLEAERDSQHQYQHGHESRQKRKRR